MLTPGWHDVAIKYGNSPRAVGGASSSVLRLFVIDAAQVRGGEGKAARACSWLGQSPPRGLEGEEQSGVPKLTASPPSTALTPNPPGQFGQH